MRNPSKMDVGPFKVSDVTDYVRGDLVAKQKVPITLEQKGRYAIFLLHLGRNFGSFV
jgi:hypothetical protein